MENDKQKINEAANVARKLIETAAMTAADMIRGVKEETSQSLALLTKDLEYIKRDISEIKSKLESDYVTRAEFAPIKMLIFGLVGLLLTGVVGALMTLILKK